MMRICDIICLTICTLRCATELATEGFPAGGVAFAGAVAFARLLIAGNYK